MDLEQLRCFVVAAEELHFGRAAQKLGILPAALGRHIKLLEEELATRLIDRTTRSVTLTGDGAILLDRARALLADAAELESQFRAGGRQQSVTLRLGSIDSAAVGMVPRLLRDFRTQRPDVEIRLFEDKTIRLLRAASISPWFDRPRLRIRGLNSSSSFTRRRWLHSLSVMLLHDGRVSRSTTSPMSP